jgi:hypothetical protein
MNFEIQWRQSLGLGLNGGSKRGEGLVQHFGWLKPNDEREELSCHNLNPGIIQSSMTFQLFL